jgi:mRNA-degrading endonuclease RelE of RelBE toxin-antitoxin system
MKSDIIFADEKIQKALNKLKKSKTEDKKLYNFLIRAFEDLSKNAFCGIQIPKKQISKDYIKKFGNLDNLWKYNLPDAWRLIYTIKNSEIIVLTIILEWMSHKDYEKRFKY